MTETLIVYSRKALLAELNARITRARKRQGHPVEPLLVQDTGYVIAKHYAHRLNVAYERGGKALVQCRFPDCGFRGRYPTREHARAVADQHSIHTHVTGSEFCGVTKCEGDAALKRKAIREQDAEREAYEASRRAARA